jgi:hypothetical protein
VERRLVPQSDGSTVTHVTVDIGTLPVPERSYVADLVGVEIRSDQARLLFAQEKLGAGKGLRSVVIVSMYHDAVEAFFGSMKATNFDEQLEEFLGKSSIVRPPLLVPPDDEPAHVVSVRANLVAASFSGPAAEMQFFHLAPMAIHRLARKSDEQSVEPVVRVDLSAAMLSSIITRLQDPTVSLHRGISP